MNIVKQPIQQGEIEVSLDFPTNRSESKFCEASEAFDKKHIHLYIYVSLQ